ncbi:MAG: esterase [Chloroflexi bacterium]|nr:esterase [Chloroflexota bacterium]
MKITFQGTSLYDPRAISITHDSRVMQVSKTLYIFLPPEYRKNVTEPVTGDADPRDQDPNDARHFPVVYFFRGHEREWLNVNEDTSRRSRNILDVYLGLAQAGLTIPMILVFPGISSTDNTINGMLINFKDPAAARFHPGVGTGRFEDYLVQEVIPLVDRHFRTIPRREARGVDGFSLGGYMSTKIAAQYPEMFSTCGAYDGLYFYAKDKGQSIRNNDPVLRKPLFRPVFGTPPDAEYVAANNPPNLILRAAPRLVQSIHWFIQYGPKHAEPNHANYYRGEHLSEMLRRQGATPLLGPLENGSHTWADADRHAKMTLFLHSEIFKSNGF